MASSEPSTGSQPQDRYVQPMVANMALHMEKELEDLLGFEAFLADLSLRFVNLPANEVDGAIEHSQRLFCRALGLDRSSLYQNFDDHAGALLMTHLYEREENAIAGKVVEKRVDPKLRSNVYWIRRDAQEPTSLVRVDIRSMWPWSYEQLQRGEPLIISNTADLPPEAAQDREMFRRYGTQSTVLMPLRSGGTRLGWITFAMTSARRNWSDVEVKRFRFIADLFSNALARKRADEALLESESRFRQVAETVTDFIWQVDPDGLYTYASPSVEKILGYSPSELIGKMHFYELFAPAVREELKAMAFGVFATRQSFRAFPNANVAKNGNIVHLETSGVPVLDETGNLNGYRGSDTDVTERRRAQEELRQSEHKFRALHESMRDAFASVDMSGRIQEFNSAFQQLLGYSEPELRNLHVADITPESWHAFEAKLVQEQVVVRGYSDVYEKEYRKKDGTVFPVELRTFLIRDDLSRPAAMWAIVRDITERKRAEQELQNNEERLRLVLEANSEGVWDWNILSGQAYFSPRYSAMLGYEPEEFAKSYTSWKEIVHPDDFERVNQAHLEHFATRKEFCVEFRMRKKNGDWCWIRSRGTVVEWAPDGKPIRMVGTHLDVTDRMRTVEALHESAERLRLAAEATGFGAFAYDFVARQGSHSPEFLALHGLPPDGDLQLDPDQVPKCLHPEDRPAVIAALQAANDPCGPGVFDLEFRIQRYDDRQVRWLRLRGRTVFTSAGPEGKPVRRHGIGQDITERKLAEEALRRSYAEIKQLKDRLQAESDYLKAEIKLNKAHGQIIGRSPGIRKVLHAVEQVAPADCVVLLTGETGTGKELIAQEIHRLSPRKDRVMVLVNCAALPTALVESELFGRERGAYTGALTSQVGRFEVANGSTIFLDEVGELSMEVQAKLLRVMQQGEFQRLGSPRTHKVDARVIAATNRDLAEEVRKGRFREDLYYRLKVFPITIPPLRERADDIPLLVFACLDEFSTRMGKKVTKIPRKAMDLLQAHSWPGNIRELRNVIEHSVILTAGDTLKLTLLGEAPTREAEPVTLAEAEREHILKTLETTGWRIKGPHGAAAKLDLQPSTLYSRMQKLGIPHRRLKDQLESQT